MITITYSFTISNGSTITTTTTPADARKRLRYLDNDAAMRPATDSGMVAFAYDAEARAIRAALATHKYRLREAALED